VKQKTAAELAKEEQEDDDEDEAQLKYSEMETFRFSPFYLSFSLSLYLSVRFCSSPLFSLFGFFSSSDDEDETQLKYSGSPYLSVFLIFCFSFPFHSLFFLPSLLPEFCLLRGEFYQTTNFVTKIPNPGSQKKLSTMNFDLENYFIGSLF
jgi:hypothetical protein